MRCWTFTAVRQLAGNRIPVAQFNTNPTRQRGAPRRPSPALRVGMLFLASCLTALVMLGVELEAAELNYKDRLLLELVRQVPDVLKTFDPDTGQFGSGIWICRDQHPMYPLAVAYATQTDGNPYYHDPKLLEAIVKSGDPLLDNMDHQGQWVFRKKDGSTWGNIWMPWTYSRWVRTFHLIRDRMPPDARQTWADALLLGYTGISKTQLRSVHNIPTHHAMGLYIAGQALDRPEWCRQAAEFMVQVVDHQAEGGYWSENAGPVVSYNFVYVDALGTYYAASGDHRVLPALEKAAAFHWHFTYPGGQNVETIDQRNPYKDSVNPGNVGFSFSPAGRSYLMNQWSRAAGLLSADLTASLILYGEEGAVEASHAEEQGQAFTMTEGGVDRAMTVRHGPWFVCLSAYTAPITNSRWIQDRQNFVSIYHDQTGLILGGGNTKLQPGWSSFTVGDVALLKHTPGDTRPDFKPKGDLYHVPQAAQLVGGPEPGLDLTYGAETCGLRVRFVDHRTLEITLRTTTESSLPVAAHLTLLPHLNEPLVTASGEQLTLGDDAIELTPEGIGGQIVYGGCRLHVPKSASLRWPALPHNPYRKDGRAAAYEGRVEVVIPLDAQHLEERITVEILETP